MEAKKIILILILQFVIGSIFGQSLESSKEIRKLLPTEITANLGTTSLYVGISINRYISPSFEAGFSAGVGFLTSSFSAGGNYHFAGNNRWSPYVGGHLIVYDDLDIFESKKRKMSSLYTPIGIQYFGPEGFTLGIELGRMTELGDSEFLTNFWGGLKVGHRF